MDNQRKIERGWGCEGKGGKGVVCAMAVLCYYNWCPLICPFVFCRVFFGEMI